LRRGSDAEITADPIDLVEWVNDEACALWDEANAEETDEE
jgi:hypothetical protein